MAAGVLDFASGPPSFFFGLLTLQNPMRRGPVLSQLKDEEIEAQTPDHRPRATLLRGGQSWGS